MAVVNDLMHQADGLFIFAATVVRYITRRPMTKREQIRLLGELGIRADELTMSRNTEASPIDALSCPPLSVVWMMTCFNNICMLSIRFSAHRNVYPPPLVGNSIPTIQTQHASFPVIIFSQARSGSVLLNNDFTVI